MSTMLLSIMNFVEVVSEVHCSLLSTLITFMQQLVQHTTVCASVCFLSQEFWHCPLGCDPAAYVIRSKSDSAQKRHLFRRHSMVKAKIRGLDGRVYLELRRVVADEYDRIRRFYKRIDLYGQFTPAREAGLKRRRDRRAAARAAAAASAAQAAQEEPRPSPARSSSSSGTIIVPPAMYVRDPAASAERRSRTAERREPPTLLARSVWKHLLSTRQL